MNCQAALEALLEAEPATLTGGGESELARHVRQCPRCARVARELAGADRALARELDALTPALGPEDAVRLARAGVAQDAARRRRRRAALATLVPLAAAAVVAGLLLLRRERLAPPAAPPTAAMAIPGAVVPVHVQSDRRFAVMATRDPNITVVWFFN